MWVAQRGEAPLSVVATDGRYPYEVVATPPRLTLINNNNYYDNNNLKKSAGPLGPPSVKGILEPSSYRLDNLSLKTDGWYLVMKIYRNITEQSAIDMVNTKNCFNEDPAAKHRAMVGT